MMSGETDKNNPPLLLVAVVSSLQTNWNYTTIPRKGGIFLHNFGKIADNPPIFLAIDRAGRRQGPSPPPVQRYRRYL
jgi:hypothetical protein